MSYGVLGPSFLSRSLCSWVSRGSQETAVLLRRSKDNKRAVVGSAHRHVTAFPAPSLIFQALYALFLDDLWQPQAVRRPIYPPNPVTQPPGGQPCGGSEHPRVGKVKEGGRLPWFSERCLLRPLQGGLPE